jgi:hypothetical protein
MDIFALISSFQTSPVGYMLTRTARGTTQRGRVQQGTTTTIFLIPAAQHPATGNDLRKLPEGRRAVETRVLYSTQEIFLGGQGAAYEADTVSIDGQNWQVEHVDTWVDSQSGARGYKAIVQAVR